MIVILIDNSPEVCIHSGYLDRTTLPLALQGARLADTVKPQAFLLIRKKSQLYSILEFCILVSNSLVLLRDESFRVQLSVYCSDTAFHTLVLQANQ